MMDVAIEELLGYPPAVIRLYLAGKRLSRLMITAGNRLCQKNDCQDGCAKQFGPYEAIVMIIP